jgi:hypothetical protein
MKGLKNRSDAAIGGVDFHARRKLHPTRLTNRALYLSRVWPIGRESTSIYRFCYFKNAEGIWLLHIEDGELIFFHFWLSGRSNEVQARRSSLFNNG